MREVLNGIFYVLKSGCQWEMLPHDFPPKGTVYDYYNTWRQNGTWEQINAALRGELREAQGRHRQPSAGIADSQSVPCSAQKGVRGTDGNKLVRGRKRHLIVDTQGWVLKAFVTEANYHDGRVASWLVTLLTTLFPRLAKLWADRAYRGRFVEVCEAHEIEADIVTPEPGQSGFEVQPRRWVVERTFAWLNNYRRLSKDYEEWVQTSDAMIYAAMSHLMVRRLAQLRATR